MVNTLDPAELQRARMLLMRPALFVRTWPVVAAAAAFAASSLLFAVAMVMAPSLTLEKADRPAQGQR